MFVVLDLARIIQRVNDVLFIFRISSDLEANCFGTNSSVLVMIDYFALS